MTRSPSVLAVILMLWAPPALAQAAPAASTASPAAPPPPAAPQSPPGPALDALATLMEQLPETLFFRPEDAGKLRESLRMGRQPKSAAASKADGKIDGKTEPPPPPPPVYNDITLSGLLYFGPASWTAWLNGVPMSRGMGDFYYEVRTATADYVDVWVSAPDPQLVRLRPHQTWRVAFGDVIERR